MDGSGCALAEEPGFRAEANRTGHNSASVRLPAGTGSPQPAPLGGLEHLDAGIQPFARDLRATPVT